MTLICFMEPQPTSNLDKIAEDAWDNMGRISNLYELHTEIFHQFANGYVALNKEGNLLFGKNYQEINERIAHSRLTGKNQSRYFQQELNEKGIPDWPPGLSCCP